MTTLFHRTFFCFKEKKFPPLTNFSTQKFIELFLFLKKKKKFRSSHLCLKEEIHQTRNQIGVA